jgi:hypothetical protein
VESIFPDTMQVETEQLQEKIQAKMGVIADLKTKLKASIEIA